MMDVFSDWKAGLARSREAAFGRLAGLLGATEITDPTWDELEALLMQADVGAAVTQDVIAALRQAVGEQGLRRAADLRDILRAELRSRLLAPPAIEFASRPAVILLVGVNGSGKTTAAAKLGKRFMDEGKGVLFGAADTFRAAVVDQLQIWGDRLGAAVVAGAPASDPGAPHAVWLVLDATSGQNALPQARAFKEAVNATGVVLAKLDSSARGGMAFAIQRELGLPILFAGLGETADDLMVFDPDAFVSGILAE